MRFEGVRQCAVAIGHLAHECGGDRRPAAGPAIGERVGRGEQVVLGHDLAHEAVLECLLGIQDVRAVEEIKRLVDADDAWQEPRGCGLGHDAYAAEHEADTGSGGCDACIHRERHRGADADGCAVDRGDDRLGAALDG